MDIFSETAPSGSLGAGYVAIGALMIRTGKIMDAVDTAAVFLVFQDEDHCTHVGGNRPPMRYSAAVRPRNQKSESEKNSDS